MNPLTELYVSSTIYWFIRGVKFFLQPALKAPVSDIPVFMILEEND